MRVKTPVAVLIKMLSVSVVFSATEAHWSSHFHLGWPRAASCLYRFTSWSCCVLKTCVYKYRPQEAGNTHVFTCATSLFLSPATQLEPSTQRDSFKWQKYIYNVSEHSTYTMLLWKSHGGLWLRQLVQFPLSSVSGVCFKH